MRRKTSGAESPSELIARLGAERADGVESTGRHGTPAGGERRPVVPAARSSRHEMPARPRRARAAADAPERAEVFNPSAVALLAFDRPGDVDDEPDAPPDADDALVAETGDADTDGPAAEAAAPRRRTARRVTGDAEDITLVTRDAEPAAGGRRSLVRRFAPVAVFALVVLLATLIAVVVRPEPDPADPALDPADVSADDPEVVRLGPDDPIAAPVPTANPDAPQTVGPDPGDGAPVPDDVEWTPAGGDEFDTGLSPSWTIYDGDGRTPAAVSVENGAMVIRGDASGRTGGIAWTPGTHQGRWEMRARFPAGDARYHPVLLLWPTENPWPAGGEIDLMEAPSGADRAAFYLHHGADNAQLFADHPLDLTQWHDFAVEWTENRITGYVDGIKYFESTDPATFPPGRMQAAIQLDWFPGAGEAGPAVPTEMQVDWMRMYR